LRYVVDRGFTAMAVTGATDPVPEYVQPISLPPAETGMQEGRLGAICCESVGGVVEDTLCGMLM
jgi:hypothetical protein